MPEGPSIVIAKEQMNLFKGKKVLVANGNAKIDFTRIQNRKITAFKSWGKHLLICFPGFFIRIHFMMFGTYRVNETKEAKPRLHLQFKKGEINFYSCSVRLIDGSADDVYQWDTDVMSDLWNPGKAKKALRSVGGNIADALLNQDIFSGVGNIIKNEVLFRTRVHPASTITSIPPNKFRKIVQEAREYSFDFYEWRKIFQLRKHWLVYKKKICPRCDLPIKKEYLGKTPRLTFFCTNCQCLYPPG